MFSLPRTTPRSNASCRGEILPFHSSSSSYVWCVCYCLFYGFSRSSCAVQTVREKFASAEYTVLYVCSRTTYGPMHHSMIVPNRSALAVDHGTVVRHEVATLSLSSLIDLSIASKLTGGCDTIVPKVSHVSSCSCSSAKLPLKTCNPTTASTTNAPQPHSSCPSIPSHRRVSVNAPPVGRACTAPAEAPPHPLKRVLAERIRS